MLSIACRNKPVGDIFPSVVIKHLGAEGGLSDIITLFENGGYMQLEHAVLLVPDGIDLNIHLIFLFVNIIKQSYSCPLAFKEAFNAE